MRMRTSALIAALKEKCKTENVMLSLPTRGMSFGDDNIEHLERAMSQLDNPEAFNIRQFTDIQVENNGQSLPLKLILAGMISRSEVVFLSAAETRDSYETCSKTGAKLPPIADYEYVEPSRIFPALQPN